MDDVFGSLSSQDRECPMFLVTFIACGTRDIFIVEDDYHRYWGFLASTFAQTCDFLIDYAAAKRRFCMIVDSPCTGSSCDRASALESILHNLNRSYTCFYNRQRGEKGRLIREESVIALHSQRDLLLAMRDMYRWLMTAGMIPDRWRFCGRYERIHGSCWPDTSPAKYSFRGHITGKLNGITERKLHYATTTDNEQQWRKILNQMSTLQWKDEYLNRLFGQGTGVHTSHDPHTSHLVENRHWPRSLQ
ncbi:MAG: hypothetical protein ACOX6K_03870 [Sphaerochaetaceae bacterium]